jgi:hypothetical protein
VGTAELIPCSLESLEPGDGFFADPSIMSPTAGVWTLGHNSWSCDDACDSIAKACSEDGLHLANTMVDSDDKMQAVMTDLGHPCGGFDHHFGYESDTPNLADTSDNTCFASAPNRGLATLSCSRTQYNKKRLCWCQKKPDKHCWVRLPTGCKKPLGETDTPEKWFIDRADESQNECPDSRWAAFQHHCQRDDVEMIFGPEPDPQPTPEVCKRIPASVVSSVRSNYANSYWQNPSVHTGKGQWVTYLPPAEPNLHAEFSSTSSTSGEAEPPCTVHLSAVLNEHLDTLAESFGSRGAETACCPHSHGAIDQHANAISAHAGFP